MPGKRLVLKVIPCTLEGGVNHYSFHYIFGTTQSAIRVINHTALDFPGEPVLLSSKVLLLFCSERSNPLAVLNRINLLRESLNSVGFEF